MQNINRLNSSLVKSTIILLSALIVGITVYLTQAIDFNSKVAAIMQLPLYPVLSTAQPQPTFVYELYKYHAVVWKAGLLVFPFELVITTFLYFCKRDWYPTDESFLKLFLKIWLSLAGITYIMLVSSYFSNTFLIGIFRQG